MRLCFIIEEKYRHESMPLAVAYQLRQWGHDVDLLEPHATVTPLFDLVTQSYDAYVLKTASEGPGLSLLEAAEAVGIPTINSARSIRLVRDKAVAIAVARAHGLPVPPTYFVAITGMQRAARATRIQHRHAPTGDGRSWHTCAERADRGAP